MTLPIKARLVVAQPSSAQQTETKERKKNQFLTYKLLLHIQPHPYFPLTRDYPPAIGNNVDSESDPSCEDPETLAACSTAMKRAPQTLCTSFSPYRTFKPTIIMASSKPTLFWLISLIFLTVPSIHAGMPAKNLLLLSVSSVNSLELQYILYCCLFTSFSIPLLSHLFHLFFLFHVSSMRVHQLIPQLLPSAGEQLSVSSVVEIGGQTMPNLKIALQISTIKTRIPINRVTHK